MKYLSTLAIGLLVNATLVYATTVNTTGDVVAKEEKVEIFPTADLTVGSGDTEQKFSLYLSGYGIRKKVVGVFKVKSYVATSYSEVKEITKSDAPLDAVLKSKAKVIKLDLLMALTADQLKTSFIEALVENEVEVTKGAPKDLLDKLTFGLPAKSVIQFASYPDKTGKLERVEILLPEKSLEAEGETLGFDFWKIWFGKPVDDEMKALQLQLIGQPKP